ncbi:hypothetical protein JCM16303_000179 [Sporobolomyces ruberrimus]
MQSNITPQQQAILLQLQQAQMHQQQPGGTRQVQRPPLAPPQAAPAPPAPNGVSTTTKHSTDGDEQYRNAKRRKPTSLALPTRFTPRSLRDGPTDLVLAPSLASLDSLSKSYKSLQEIESRLDWTFSRKAIELTEKSRGTATDEGERVNRTMRIHVQAKVRDQEEQFDGEGELEKAGEVPKSEDANVKDESQTKVPFTRHYQRITIESPLLPTPLVWNRSSSFPRSLHFTIPYSLPPSSSSSESPPPLSLKISLYPFSYSHSPTSQLFTLVPPELSSLLSLSECTRPEALHHLWSYVRSNNLTLENIDGRGTGGIKTQESAAGGGLNKKFFGGMDKVAWHHLGEWVNRWLGPTVPRVIDYSLTPSVSKDADHHRAYDVPLSTFPSSSSASPTTSQHRLQTAALLSSLSTSSSSTTNNPHSIQSPGHPTPPQQLQHPLHQALESINSQIANSTLQVTTHLLQLDSLMSFTRDPSKFLETYLENQASDLDVVLSKGGNGRGDKSMGIGEGWKESLRGSKYFKGEGEGEGDGEWVKEAVGVWLAREREGELRKQLAQASQAQQQQQGGASAGRR